MDKTDTPFLQPKKTADWHFLFVLVLRVDIVQIALLLCFFDIVYKHSSEALHLSLNMLCIQKTRSLLAEKCCLELFAL